MSAVPPNPSALPTSGLARALVQANAVSAVQIDTIQKKIAVDKSHFLDALIHSGAINTQDLASFCSETFGYPQMDLSAFSDSALPEKIIDLKMMQTHKVLALSKKANKVSIALSDPTNTVAIDQIKFQTGLSVDLVIVQHDALMKIIDKLSKTSEQTLTDLSADDYELEFNEEDMSSGVADAQAAEVDDAPVVKFLQKMLIDAINMGASDLHFEPFEKFYRIRFRIDGELREISQPPLAIKDKLVSRIKVISKLDISEKRVPQDGRMKLALSPSKAIDFRVSTLPTLFGEK
ncbi:MAG: Flp pilus assembly complex ATPase component TadA, partial [Undibacterium sp.]|nr:Flp pilus assembly complex ATPase component TadA [Undibacterium sp.]